MQDFSFGNLLTSYRVRLGYTQKEVTEELEISPRSYQRWENDEGKPPSEMLQRLVLFFKLTDAEADTLYRSAGQVAPEVQNIPFPRNLFFTGREALLKDLSQLFKRNESVAITQPISISGLGGIGKTQIALEYAHRCYHSIYRAVLWANAADRATLEEGYLSLAKLLNLPERDEREIDFIIQAVKRWLERHTNWLLVLDNADDLQLARSFLPTNYQGHILFTTRTQILGNIAASIEVDAMGPEEGLLFLLKRADVIQHEIQLETVEPHIREFAIQLVELLGGHPLALDQAGAYIEESRESFANYIRIYQEHRLILLNKRGSLGNEHPETVVVTFEISFQHACHLCPTASDVLHLCSFLQPDDIPTELFSQENDLKLDTMTFNEAIGALRRYSLIKRNMDENFLSVHRLVQVVLKDPMDKEIYRQWSERTVRIVNQAFPDVEFENWQRCQRLLPQAQACISLIEELQMQSEDACRLLNEVGHFSMIRGQYLIAEKSLALAVAIGRKLFMHDDPNLAFFLSNLALAYRSLGKYEQAEPLADEALTIRKQKLGLEHPDTAQSLNNLGDLYRAEGKNDLAGPLFEQALTIREKILGAGHPYIATSLSNLASYYRELGEYKQAEPLFWRALGILKQHFGEGHPYVAVCLSNLSRVYIEQGKYPEAEDMCMQVLNIYEKEMGKEHPEISPLLNNLSEIYFSQGKYTESEAMLRRVISIDEQQLGLNHSSTATSIDNLSTLLMAQGKYEEAEKLSLQALAIWENILEGKHPNMAYSLTNLASIYRMQNKYTEAEPLLLRVLAIRQGQLGTEHLNTAESLNNLASLYTNQGKYAEAEPLYKRALAICEQKLGQKHPNTLIVRRHYIELLRLQKRDTEADLLESVDTEL